MRDRHRIVKVPVPVLFDLSLIDEDQYCDEASPCSETIAGVSPQ